jgi:hypothetical protein
MLRWAGLGSSSTTEPNLILGASIKRVAIREAIGRLLWQLFGRRLMLFFSRMI